MVKPLFASNKASRTVQRYHLGVGIAGTTTTKFRGGTERISGSVKRLGGDRIPNLCCSRVVEAEIRVRDIKIEHGKIGGKINAYRVGIVEADADEPREGRSGTVGHQRCRQTKMRANG